ncbi:MAG: hypothetical protein R2991_07110 [Thermoanaerobaculia bacterium]
MEAVNALLRRVVDASLAPFMDMPSWVGIAVVTLVVTLVAMPVIKWTLNPAWSDRMKSRLYAAIFELRLFNDSLRATFRALFDMLRWTAGYLGVWTMPILILGVFMFPLFAHLHAHWGYKGLVPGEETVLTAHLAETGGAKPDVTLSAPDGVTVETPSLWIASRGELLWRLRADAPGQYQLALEVDGQRADKTVTVATGSERRSPARPRGFLGQLLYPSEPPLPAGPVEEVSLEYEETSTFLLVLTWCWILILLSIPIAFALKKPFGVEF